MSITMRTLTEQEVHIVHESIEAPREFFGDNYFKEVVISQDGMVTVDSIIKNSRDLAPFVSPLVPGKPVAMTGSTVSAFRPAYLSMLNTVNPNGGTTTKNLTKTPYWSTDPMTRHGEKRREIIEDHQARVRRTVEFMRAMGTIRGYVDTESKDVPAERINFGRNAALTMATSTGAHWGDTDVSAMDYIERMVDLLGETDGGSSADTLLVGSRVAAFIRRSMRNKDGEFRDALDRNFGVESTLVRGLAPYAKIREMGTLNGFLKIVEYNESFHGFDKDGNRVWLTPLLPNQICMIGADFQGKDAYGAIEDLAAGYKAMPMFTRNYISEGTPQVEVVSTQSAPIPVPVNKNATALATVMA